MTSQFFPHRKKSLQLNLKFAKFKQNHGTFLWGKAGGRGHDGECAKRASPTPQSCKCSVADMPI